MYKNYFRVILSEINKTFEVGAFKKIENFRVDEPTQNMS